VEAARYHDIMKAVPRHERMGLHGRKFMKCIAVDTAALADPTIAFAGSAESQVSRPAAGDMWWRCPGPARSKVRRRLSESGVSTIGGTPKELTS
jgi:hypothetical protein